MKEFLKFSKTKIFLSLAFVIWQLIYNFKLIAFLDLSLVGDYFKNGFTFINWDNYFLRKFSFLVLWVVVAGLVFVAVYLYETISTYSFNKKIEKEFTNQPRENYDHMLKKMGDEFWRRFYPKLYKISAIGLVILAIFSISSLIENIRMFFIDILIADLEENSQNFNSYLLLTLSFIFVLPFWYPVSAALVWLNKKGAMEEKEERVAEEHFAVKVEEVKPEEESE